MNGRDMLRQVQILFSLVFRLMNFTLMAAVTQNKEQVFKQNKYSVKYIYKRVVTLSNLLRIFFESRSGTGSPVVTTLKISLIICYKKTGKPGFK